MLWGVRTQIWQTLMSPSIDLAHFRQVGWVRIADAIPVELCDRLVAVLECELWCAGPRSSSLERVRRRNA